MKMDIWPFLFTRNPSLDYRAVLCPRFILEANRSGIFREILAQDLDAESEEFTRVAHKADGTLGELTVVYRGELARIDGRAETDPQGRPIRRYVGAIVKGNLGDLDGHADRIVRSVAPDAEEVFSRFWRQKAFKPEPSMPRDYRQPGPNPNPDPNQNQNQNQYPPIYLRIALAIAIIGAIAFAVRNAQFKSDIEHVTSDLRGQLAQERNARSLELQKIREKITHIESDLAGLRGQAGSK